MLFKNQKSKRLQIQLSGSAVASLTAWSPRFSPQHPFLFPPKVDGVGAGRFVDGIDIKICVGWKGVETWGRETCLLGLVFTGWAMKVAGLFYWVGLVAMRDLWNLFSLLLHHKIHHSVEKKIPWEYREVGVVNINKVPPKFWEIHGHVPLFTDF